METLSLDSLKADSSFTGDLLLDSSFLILPASAIVTDSLIKSLKDWGFNTLMCDGGISLGGDIVISSDTNDSQPNTDAKIADSVKKAIETSRSTSLGNSDQARMKMVTDVYYEYMNYIETLFTRYTTHKQINQEELSETVQELCVFIKDHRRYMLRINPDASECSKNFLVIHTMRSTVLAIAIAMEMHLGLSKMIEVGVSCILHEIGMLRLPPQTYMSERKLTPGEKASITKHSIFGYTIVKDLNFPIQIQLGVLEHHEKENGTGYPQKKTGDKISQNAKIISVACSYEAISSQRSYKNERSTFEAIVELLQNKEHAYDDQIIRALVHTVSLYPIGSYVYLSNRKIAIVIDVNPVDPKSPVVQILTEREKDGSLKTVTTNQTDTKIVRILTKSERNDMLNVINEKYKIIEQAQNNIDTEVETKASETESNSNSSSNNKNGMEEVDINSFLV